MIQVNGLLALSFEKEDNRISFSKYYTPSVGIKGCNVLIDGESFSGTPIKMKNKYIKKYRNEKN